MGETVRLEAAGTIVPARTLVFRAPAALVAGRAEDCGLRVTADDRRVSRRHCAFDIDPPAVRVRDLGSRNGTYVNGVRLAPSAARPHELADGDEVRLGGAVVGIFSTGPGTRGDTAPRTPDGRPRPAGAARIGDYTLGGRPRRAGGGDGTVRVWDLRTSACVHVLTGHHGPVGSVCVTPDGRYALSGGIGEHGGGVSGEGAAPAGEHDLPEEAVHQLRSEDGLGPEHLQRP
ncbi:FHA domain-containing protein [Streptomyces eurythermus]